MPSNAGECPFIPMSDDAPAPVTIKPLGNAPDVAAPIAIRTSPAERNSDGDAAGAGVLPRLKNGAEWLVGVASVVYALGYLSWALFAWDQRFGLPPALEGQYFITGLVPSVLLVLLAGALQGLWRLRSRLRRPATADEHRIGRVINAIAVVLVLLGFAVGFSDARTLEGALIGCGLALFVAGWFLSSEKLDRMFARGATWYFLVFAPVLFLVALQLFVRRVCPHIPSELGGPASAPFRLDLARGDLSAETLELLGADPRADADVFRTIPLRVIMAPGDFHIVVLERDDRQTRVKIRRDAVRAIVSETSSTLP